MWPGQAIQKLFSDMDAALHVLHLVRLIHTDIRPKNILVGFWGTDGLDCLEDLM